MTTKPSHPHEAGGAARWFWPCLLLLTAIGLALRLLHYADLNLTQWDEGPYVGWSMGKGPCVRQDPLIVYAPPLFPWLCGAAMRLLGPEPRLGIGIAALFGGLCVLLAGLLTRRWFGALAGLCAAALLCGEPLLLAYSRMALTETTFTAGALLTLWLGTRALETRRARDAVLFGMAAGLSTAAKFHGVLPLFCAGLGVSLELLQRGGPNFATTAACLRSRGRTLLLAGVAAVPFGLLVLWFIVDAMSLAAFSDSRKTWVDGLHLYTISGTLRFLVDTVRLFGAPGMIALALIGGVLALPRLRRAEHSSALLYPALLLLVLITYRDYTRLVVPLFAVLAPLAGHAAVRIAGAIAGRHLTLAAAVIVLLAAATGAHNAREAVCFHSDAYPRMASLLTEQLRREPGTTIAVAQQSLFPYLADEIIAQVWSITEPEAWQLLAAGELRYLLTDQDPARHARVRELFPTFESRLELIASLDNPLAPVLLFDRLGRERYARLRADPDAPDLRAETELRLYRLKPR